MSSSALFPVSDGAAPTQRDRLALLLSGGHLGSIAIIVLLCAVGFLIKPAFLSPSNIWSVLSITAMLAIASSGQTLVIVSGNQGIDLSVGAIMTFAALLVSGITGSSDAALPVAVATAIGMGAAVGLVSGIGVHMLGLYPLIMTLGVSFVVEGLGLIYAQARAPSMPSRLVEAVGDGRIAGIPWIIVLAIVVAIGMTLGLRRTRYGQMLYLVGANARAARAAGISTGKVLIATYIMSGVLSAIAGVLLFGFAGAANLSLGALYTMMSVAAVVIGGASLSGGKGSYIGTLFGALIFTLLTNLLITLGFNTALRYIVSGLVLVVVLFATSREEN